MLNEASNVCLCVYKAIQQLFFWLYLVGLMWNVCALLIFLLCMWLCRHRHLPKPIYKAASLRRTMMEAERRKAERRKAHSAPGSIVTEPVRKRRIIKEVEWVVQFLKVWLDPYYSLAQTPGPVWHRWLSWVIPQLSFLM